MMFHLSKDGPQPGYRDLMTILGRTGARDWEDLDLLPEAPSLKACLLWPESEISQVALGTARLAQRLEAGWDAAERPRGEEASGQAPWLRATAVALGPFAVLEAHTGVSAERLGDEIDRDTILRSLAIYGGRIKDGALDARLFVGGFGWYLVSRVLDGLRAAVAGLAQAEAEAILSPFSPMLVVIGQMMEEREGKQKKSRAETEALSDEVAEATAERDEAAARVEMHRTKDLPKEKLAQLARTAETKPAPAAGRRNRRR